MKNIIAFAGSTSKNSLNKKLATYAVNQIGDANIEVLDLNNFPLPLYGIDLENEQGIPKNAHLFLEKIKQADGLVISLAEHNGAYSTAFKNIFDWMSRIDGKLWSDVPMLLMATSPGKRGGASVLEIAANRFPYMGGTIIATFSLPSFNDNFKEGKIVDAKQEDELNTAIAALKNAVFID